MTSETKSLSGNKHLTAEKLKSEAAARYSWKIYWAGPRDTEEFELAEMADGGVRVVYLIQGSLDIPTKEFFLFKLLEMKLPGRHGRDVLSHSIESKKQLQMEIEFSTRHQI